MRILGIETSCDETSAAIVEDGKKLLSHIVASSAKLHQKYGGIVPEVAARKQVEVIIPVLTEALNNINPLEIDAIAVTVGPGLIGSLLVGVETAKTLAFVWNKPIIPVNHVLAHIYAVFLENSSVIPNSFRDPQQISKAYGVLKLVQHDKKIYFPAIALVVSGGHTELYLMKNTKSLKWLGGTLDDAAGECFDKTARLLGLPYPGGPAIAAEAAKFQVSSFKFKLNLPRPMINDESLNFSFSGLKTAVLREWNKCLDSHSRETCPRLRSGNGNPNKNLLDPRVTRLHLPDAKASGGQEPEDDKLISEFSFEIQEAITDVLVAKTLKAAEKYQAKSVIVTGGVAANKRLTEKFNSKILNLNSKFSLHVPPPPFCVDSASYIAAAAFYLGQSQPWYSIEAKPDLSVEVK